MQTRIGPQLDPGRPCSALALTYLLEEVRDLQDHLSWKPASRTIQNTLDPFSTEGRALRFNAGAAC